MRHFFVGFLLVACSSHLGTGNFFSSFLNSTRHHFGNAAREFNRNIFGAVNQVKKAVEPSVDVAKNWTEENVPGILSSARDHAKNLTREFNRNIFGAVNQVKDAVEPSVDIAKNWTKQNVPGIVGRTRDLVKHTIKDVEDWDTASFLNQTRHFVKPLAGDFNVLFFSGVNKVRKDLPPIVGNFTIWVDRQFSQLADSVSWIGSQNIIKGNLPFQVQLRQNENVHFCGGAILNSYLVLTAAHCVYESVQYGNFSRIDVVAGIHHRKKIAGTEQVGKIHKIIFHPGYKNGFREDDLAILVLETEYNITANPYVQSIELPNPNVDHAEMAQMVSWGMLTSKDKETPDVPSSMNLTIYDHESCREDWQKSLDMEYKKSVNMDKMICAKPERNSFKKSTCNADSGSPLVCTDFEGEGGVEKVVVCGITSFASEDCGIGTGKPSVFMDVSKYLDWIKKQFLITRARYCPRGYFRCIISDICVPSERLCEGTDDCGDNSDEVPDMCDIFKQVNQ